jgi:hypothetical protein
VSIAKHFNLILCSTGIGLAFQLGGVEITNVFDGWVILSAEKAVTNWGFSDNCVPLWNPPTNQVAEAMQRLPDYLQQAQTNSRSSYTNKLSGIRERLSRTACQFVGVTKENQKGILLNCIPMTHEASSGWKDRFVKVFDGGPQWWSVIYFPAQKQFTQLHVDLGY